MTDFHVHFTQSSESDLEEIIFFISQDNITRAITFTDEITDFIKSQLSTFPFSGIKQGDGGLMIIYRKSVLIYYDVDTANHIVNILHIKRSSKPLEYFS